MVLASITFYSVVLFVHVAAVVVAFGVTFTYPMIVPLTQRAHTRNLPFLHTLQFTIGQRIITPAATLILLAGIYLTAKSPLYELSDWWVGLGLALILILLGLAGAFFIPTERRISEVARRDVEAAGPGELEMSAEYEQLAKRLGAIGGISSLLVLTAIFVMVMGSRGYL